MYAKMILPRFELEAPRSVAEAVALLSRAGAEGRILAGGTDLLVKMKRGDLAPRLLVSLREIEGLQGILPGEGGGMHLGTRVTMADLERSAPLRQRFSALAEGAAAVGGPLIRNRATVGGNVANARPCADTVPPLVALGACLRLLGPGGARTAPVDGFITGPGETEMAADEMICGIELPGELSARAGSAYLKIARRRAMEVTVVGCAACLQLNEARDRVTRARLVLTSVATVPLRVDAAEPLLEGERPTEAALDAAAAAARRAVRPIDDHRATAAYRSQVVEVAARRTLQLALRRAQERDEP